MKTRISVITVCLNSEDTIAETIESVKLQEYDGYEHIIFDGGSKDKTLDIIEERKHSKMHLFEGVDSGIYDAMNQAAKFAQGEVLHFLNSDDLYDSNHTLGDVAHAFFNSDQKVLCTAIKYFETKNPDRTTRRWMPTPFSSHLIEKGWHPPHPGFFCRREVFDSCGGFNCKYSIVADFDFMIRACASYPNCVSVTNMTTVRMRAGGASDRNIISTLKNNLDVCSSLREQGFKIYRPLYILRRLSAKGMQLLRKNATR